MSKITLTPNASGTGTFTVASPNSNTNRTLTLPDEAGELLINGTTSNVGIGTSSPSAPLTVDTGAGTFEVKAKGSGSVTLASDASLTYFGSTHEFYNAAGTTTHAVINSSGNVGIGTSSPTTKLQSKGGSISTPTNNAGLIANASASFVVEHGNDYGIYTGYVNSTNDAVGIAATRTLGGALPLSLQPFGGNVGIGTSSPSSKLHVSGTYDTILDGNSVQFTRAGPSYIQNNTAGGYTVFQQASGEAMRIDSSGNLLVGKTSGTSDYFLQVGGSSSKGSIRFDNAYSSQTVCLINNSSNTNFNFAVFENGGSTKGSILVTTTGTAYNTSSDYRLKTDAQPMTGASARVQALNPVNFEWIADGTRVDGFLAHEAQEVVPEAVSGTKDAMRDEEYEVTPAVYEDVVIPAVLDEDGNELEAERTEQQLVTEAVMGTRSVPDYQGIDQSKLVPLLTAALQEALTEISDLKARVTALEAV